MQNILSNNPQSTLVRQRRQPNGDLLVVRPHETQVENSVRKKVGHHVLMSSIFLARNFEQLFFHSQNFVNYFESLICAADFRQRNCLVVQYWNVEWCIKLVKLKTFLVQLYCFVYFGSFKKVCCFLLQFFSFLKIFPKLLVPWTVRVDVQSLFYMLLTHIELTIVD